EYNGGQFNPSFVEWQLCSLSLELRQNLIKQIFLQIRDTQKQTMDDPDRFVATLEKHVQLRGWGKNPLLVSLAAGAFVRNDTLPVSRVALYKETTMALFAARKANPNRQTMMRMI